MTINVLYRLSDNSYKKPRLANSTKMHCLENAMFNLLGCKWHMFVDNTNLKEETKIELEKLNHLYSHFEYYTGGSSAQSFRHVLDYSLSGKFEENEIIYFLEDDYLHLPGSSNALLEGLEIAHYVSLYDHNDKYIPASKGGNPYIDEDGGEVTKVYRTKSTHWKLTNSTTMTFATTVKQLKSDQQEWMDFTAGTHPNDFGCFITLRGKERSLITPIPGLSTHCEPMWVSPGTDWETV